MPRYTARLTIPNRAPLSAPATDAAMFFAAWAVCRWIKYTIIIVFKGLAILVVLLSMGMAWLWKKDKQWLNNTDWIRHGRGQGPYESTRFRYREWFGSL